jgi:hypothetical protein
MAKNYVGKSLKIKEGMKVTRAGRTSARKVESVVTIRGQEPTRNGKTRVFWKSHGVKASTILG